MHDVPFRPPDLRRCVLSSVLALGPLLVWGCCMLLYQRQLRLPHYCSGLRGNPVDKLHGTAVATFLSPELVEPAVRLFQSLYTIRLRSEGLCEVVAARMMLGSDASCFLHFLSLFSCLLFFFFFFHWGCQDTLPEKSQV